MARSKSPSDPLTETLSEARWQYTREARMAGMSSEEFPTFLRRSFREHRTNNELGLYRNAALQLAYYHITQEYFSAALARLAEVLFLDICGVTNSLPGHRSFDLATSDVAPFVATLTRAVLARLALPPDTLRKQFTQISSGFTAFQPPLSAESAFTRVASTINET